MKYDSDRNIIDDNRNDDYDNNDDDDDDELNEILANMIDMDNEVNMSFMG
jgi:hypothetical protein